MKKCLLFALLSCSCLCASEGPVKFVEEETPIVLDVVDRRPASDVPPTHLQEEQYKKQFIKMLFLILGAVFGFFLLAWLVRRFSTHARPLSMNSKKHIKVIERRPLSPQTQLFYVQVGDRHFVLAESKVEVRNVASLDWEVKKEVVPEKATES